LMTQTKSLLQQFRELKKNEPKSRARG